MPRTVPLVIGHRGAPGYRPEHTRSSYAQALAAGVDAVEPDVVVSADGVLVVRHENEIAGTTDIASRPEFAARRTTKQVDGQPVTGWFAEDLTWAELATLRTRERLPPLRPGSAAFDGAEPMLRLCDVLEAVAEASDTSGRPVGAVVEIKHATYFRSCGWDVAVLLADELRAAGWADGRRPLVVESFESTVLDAVRAEGVQASFVYLLEASGRPFDLAGRPGAPAGTYAWTASPEGLDTLVGRYDGISVDKSTILGADPRSGPTRLVADAHGRGLTVFTWTARPENAFLSPVFRTAGPDAAFGDYAGEWQVLADAEVDGVFVDHPDLGIAAFRTR